MYSIQTASKGVAGIIFFEMLTKYINILKVNVDAIIRFELQKASFISVIIK